MSELVVFDLDGTLIDSGQDLLDAANIGLAEVGMAPLPQKDIRGLIGEGSKGMVLGALRAQAGLFEKAYAAFTQHYEVHLLDHTDLFAGTREALLGLHGKKHLAVLTNKREKFTRPILEGLKIDHLFSSIVGGDTYAKKKPDPYPLLEICDHVKVSPEKTVMVGDSPVDVETGRRAGSLTVFVQDGFSDPDTGLTSGADLLLPDVATLAPYLLPLPR